jgi:hypothetical protein
MKKFKYSYYLIAIVLSCFSFNLGFAQKRDSGKDTLRIKVYTQIKYVDGRMQNVEIEKVFCDYCSPLQIEALEDEARSIIRREKMYWTRGKENKIQRYTLIISVARKDLLALKEQEKYDDN